MRRQDHFVMFVSRDEERTELERKYPNVEFTWVSRSALPGAHVLDDAAVPRLAEELRQRQDRRPFVGVLNRREKFVGAAARLAECLALPRHVKSVPAVRDKLCMRRALDAIPGNPRCWPIDCAADFEAMAPQCYPLILKPRFGFNSRSIGLVRDRREAVRVWRRLQARYACLKNEEKAPRGFLAEEFVSGREHTVEALVADGTIIRAMVSDKLAVQPPFFTEIGDTMPTTLCAADTERVLDAARQAVAAVGIVNGWCHIEIKCSPTGPVVIEIAARMGGGYHEELIELTYGVDRLGKLMDLFAGRPIDQAGQPRVHASGLRLVHAGAGWQLLRPRLRRLANEPDVQFVWPRTNEERPRWVLGPPLGFKNTVFEFIVTGENGGENASRCRELAQRHRGRILPLPTSVVRTYQRFRRGREIDG